MSWEGFFKADAPVADSDAVPACIVYLYLSLLFYYIYIYISLSLLICLLLFDVEWMLRK